MKKKILIVLAISTLMIAGCGKKNQPEPEPEDRVINPTTEEGRNEVKESFNTSIDLYSNPSNFKAVHVSEEAKDLSLILGLGITETSKYGLNEVNLSFTRFNFKAEEFVRIDDARKAEGMVNVKDLSGNVAMSAGLLQPLTGQKEGEEPVGIFTGGDAVIAPMNFDVYLKDGNAYADLSHAGIRQTLTNAGELAAAGYNAYQELMAAMEEMNKPQQPQPQEKQPLLYRE